MKRLIPLVFIALHLVQGNAYAMGSTWQCHYSPHTGSQGLTVDGASYQAALVDCQDKIKENGNCPSCTWTPNGSPFVWGSTNCGSTGYITYGKQSLHYKNGNGDTLGNGEMSVIRNDITCPNCTTNDTYYDWGAAPDSSTSTSGVLTIDIVAPSQTCKDFCEFSPTGGVGDCHTYSAQGETHLMCGDEMQMTGSSCGGVTYVGVPVSTTTTAVIAGDSTSDTQGPTSVDNGDGTVTETTTTTIIESPDIHISVNNNSSPPVITQVATEHDNPKVTETEITTDNINNSQTTVQTITTTTINETTYITNIINGSGSTPPSTNTSQNPDPQTSTETTETNTCQGFGCDPNSNGGGGGGSGEEEENQEGCDPNTDPSCLPQCDPQTDPDCGGGCDPSKGDECGFSGGGDCNSQPTCNGAPITCAVARYTWRMNCIFAEPTATELQDAIDSGQGGRELVEKEEVDIGNMLGSLQAQNAACIDDFTISTPWTPLTFKLSLWCDFFRYTGYLVLLGTGFVALRMFR